MGKLDKLRNIKVTVIGADGIRNASGPPWNVLKARRSYFISRFRGPRFRLRTEAAYDLFGLYRCPSYGSDPRIDD